MGLAKRNHPLVRKDGYLLVSVLWVFYIRFRYRVRRVLLGRRRESGLHCLGVSKGLAKGRLGVVSPCHAQYEKI